MPLDTYVDAPVALMDNNGDGDRPAVWDKYEEIVKANEGDKNFELMERFACYDRARKAYAVIATGETAVYANIILKKGVVKELGGLCINGKKSFSVRLRRVERTRDNRTF